MEFQALRIVRFKTIDDTTIAFTNPVTLVSGPNECGKSTILEAIIVSLFEDPTKTKKAVEQYRSWRHDALPELTLDFKDNGAEFSLRKDFELRTVALDNRSTGESWSVPSEVATILEGLWPYSDEQLYRRLCLLTHHDLPTIQRGRKSLDDALYRIQSQQLGSANPREIIARLEKKRKELTKGLDHISKEPGVIKQWRDERERQEKALETLNEREENVQTVERQRRELQRTLHEIEEERTTIEREIRAMTERSELERRYDAMANEHRTLVAKTEEAQRTEKLVAEQEGALGDNGELDSLMNDFREAMHINELLRADARRRDQAATNMEQEDQQSQHRRYRYALVFAGVLACATVIIAIIVSPWALCGLILPLALWALMKSGKGKRTNARTVAKEERNEASQGEERGDERRLRDIISAHRAETLEDLAKMAKEANEQRHTLHERKGKLNGILLGETLHALMDRRRDLEGRLAIAQRAIEQTRVPKGGSIDRWEHRLKQLLERERECGRELEALQALRNRDIGVAEEVKRIREMLHDIKNKERDALQTLRVIELLLESIPNAQMRATRALVESIEESMGTMLSTITRGKYERIRLSMEYELEVEERQTGKWVSPDEALSAGTIDQVYVAARLALMKHIWNNAKILVLLDDPFLSFDAERTRGAGELLQTLTGSMHFIFATHSSERYPMIIDAKSNG